MNVGHDLRPCGRINSCHISTLNVNARSAMLLEKKNVGQDLHYHEVSKAFLSRSESIKKKTDKLDYIKIRNFSAHNRRC